MFGRRKKKTQEPDGVTVRIYSVHSIQLPRHPVKNTFSFDFLLGFLLIGLLVAGGTLRPAWLRWAAKETAPAQVADTVAKPELDSPPSVKRVVPASYTEQARNAGFHGRVSVIVYVDATGVPEDIEAASPIPFDLERSIRSAVFQWRFRPARSRGVAVAGRTLVEVPFR
jgi:TonB family protein